MFWTKNKCELHYMTGGFLNPSDSFLSLFYLPTKPVPQPAAESLILVYSNELVVFH
jgi:hypothetical protein